MMWWLSAHSRMRPSPPTKTLTPSVNKLPLSLDSYYQLQSKYLRLILQIPQLVVVPIQYPYCKWDASHLVGFHEPHNKLRNKFVIITSKRRFDVITKYLLRTMFYLLGC